MKAQQFLSPVSRVCIAVVVGCSLLGGCMPPRVNLIRTGAVSVRTEAPPSLRLSAAAYAEPDTLFIYGTVEERIGTLYPVVGHIDVEVWGADSRLLDAQRVPYRVRTTHRKKYRRATFSARFPRVPPQGSVLIVRHHLDMHTCRDRQTSAA